MTVDDLDVVELVVRRGSYVLGLSDVCDGERGVEHPPTNSDPLSLIPIRSETSSRGMLHPVKCTMSAEGQLEPLKASRKRADDSQLYTP
jgi:hypothetical protein